MPLADTNVVGGGHADLGKVLPVISPGGDPFGVIDVGGDPCMVKTLGDFPRDPSRHWVVETPQGLYHTGVTTHIYNPKRIAAWTNDR